ncbi:MAG: DUF1559 domain-containing protein [Planctomycetes bacterium]|nr:DUF1559 domain-containing protein [Planctomycetota bacterium]
MSTKSPARGYTLRELLAVVTIIAVLLGLSIPAIQSARERARRTQCSNNMKNLALGLQNYHDTYKMFPMGVMHSGLAPGGDPPINGALGPSWWYGTIPFLVSNSLYDKLSATQRPGGPIRPEFCANDMMGVGVPLDTRDRFGMRCPSSGLPVTETRGGPIVLPTYVGIAGGCDIDPNSYDYKFLVTAATGLVAPATRDIYHNRFKGTGAAAGGIVTSSGLLPPCEHVRFDMILDGTANTMLVAEQSDWLRDRNPRSRAKYHGDPGWTVGGTGAGGGFLSGTTRVDPVPPVATPGGPPSVWGADCWNITTVRYPPNHKRVIGANPLPGCSENHGINNPLQSPHPGGLQVGMADGSTMFVANDTELAVLLQMAIRDDAPRADPGK